MAAPGQEPWTLRATVRWDASQAVKLRESILNGFGFHKRTSNISQLVNLTTPRHARPAKPAKPVKHAKPVKPAKQDNPAKPVVPVKPAPPTRPLPRHHATPRLPRAPLNYSTPLV
jgi:hypothetical protein